MAQINKVKLPNGTTYDIVPSASDITVKSKLYFEAVNEDNVTYKKLVAEYVPPDPDDIDTAGTLTVYNLDGNTMFTMDMNGNRFNLLRVVNTLIAGTLRANNLTANRILVSDADKNIVSSSLSVSNLITTSNIGSQSVNYASSAGTANYATSAGKLDSLGILIPETGRTANRGGVYSYNTYAENSGAPTRFSSIIGFGRGAGGTAEICCEWTGGQGIWVRSLRDFQDNWYNWIQIITSKGGTINGDINLSGNYAYKLNNRAQLYDIGSNVCGLCADGGTTVRKYSSINTYAPIYASAFSQQSSKLVKENITSINDSDAKKLLDVDVVSFDYIKEVGGNKNNVGMIAEDVLKIYPNLVQVPDDYSEEKAKDSIYNGVNTETLGIDYAKFTPYLIKMVQIQQRQIEELKAEVERLKDVIES